MHAAVERLASACAARGPAWSAVVDAHDALHTALVAASGSARIVAAHAALAGETRLFLVQLRPAWTLERMAADHERLVDALERDGPEALRAHLRESAAAALEVLQREALAVDAGDDRTIAQAGRRGFAAGFGTNRWRDVRAAFACERRPRSQLLSTAVSMRFAARSYAMCHATSGDNKGEPAAAKDARSRTKDPP